jgi:transcriptional regulator with XRE-family HTH domain
MDEMSVFNERLNTLMKSRGVNQVKLCELTGLSSAQANYLVKGKTRDPKITTACKIALAFDVSLDYLAGIIDEPRPIQRDKDGNPTLTTDERQLVDLYRDTDNRGKRSIMGSALQQQDELERGEAGNVKKSNSDSRRTA